MDQHDGAKISYGRTIGLLARAIERHTVSAGDHVTALPALSLHRRDAPTEPVHCIYDFGLAVTAQGAKQVMLGDKVFHCGPGGSMLTPIDLPIVAHITHATKQEPYLGLMLRLDTRSIALAASELKLTLPGEDATPAPISIETLDPPVLGALHRLMELLEAPLLPNLAPLIHQEIVFRLLMSRHGSHLRKLVAKESPSQQIARVVAWMKLNFTETVPMAELAAKANMSPSTFRQHFREITGMSPLQYQKQLRLKEARQLMLNRNMDAGLAASVVGYESASQFSREYNRVFGAPPLRDVRRMRADYSHSVSCSRRRQQSSSSALGQSFTSSNERAGGQV
jgi:AraC-like DNA-binding protein